jgi:hypothetical protein
MAGLDSIDERSVYLSRIKPLTFTDLRIVEFNVLCIGKSDDTTDRLSVFIFRDAIREGEQNVVIAVGQSYASRT